MAAAHPDSATPPGDPEGPSEGTDAEARPSSPPDVDGDLEGVTERDSEGLKARAAVEASRVARFLSSRPPPALNTDDLRASNKELRQKEAEEDRALIALVQGGDRAAFRQLVERHQRRAFVLALGLVRDENDAREVVQEAFLRVHKNLANFQGTSSFFTWLYRIVTNLSIDLIRKPGRQLAEIDEERLDTEDIEFPLLSRIDGADPADVVRRRELAGRMQEAIDALPPYHRAVIIMREIDGLSYEEMAVAMDVSKGTIMSRLFHARQKLQKALAGVYEEQIGAVPTDSATATGGHES